ncbi:MAG: prepilin peptidase [bacterium]|nr:prepilin peptidase [bacterium]
MNAAVFLSGGIGLAVGSFLNVVMYRYDPAFSETMRRAAPTSVGASLARRGRGRFKYGGRSFCFSCKKELSWFELIPLVSFIIQKRKCRGCGALISWQYPAVELGTATAFALIAYQYFAGTLLFL